MVVVMQKGAAPEARERVLAEIKRSASPPTSARASRARLIGAIGPAPTEEIREHLRALPGVETVVRITKPYKLASREFRHDDSAVRIGDVVTGAGRFVVAAGPCGVESREQLRRRPASPTATAPRCCAAAPSSRAPAPTRSRGWARRGWPCWPRRARRPACRSSPR
jgi:hypothetical protein